MRPFRAADHNSRCQDVFPRPLIPIIEAINARRPLENNGMNPREDFELLEARTGDVPVEMPWRRDTPWMNPRAVFTSGSPTTGSSSSEHITAVIGKNGTGKSHLLSAIAQTFVVLEELQAHKRRTVPTLPLELLSYRINGRVCTVKRTLDKQLNITVDDKRVGLSALPLPRRVVALTISPFDKFPVPRTATFSAAPAELSSYTYLGLRDRFGKAAIETLLFRSLTNLFEERENENLRRINIGAVFEFLGLQPRLSVIYELRVSVSLRQALAQGARLTDPAIFRDRSQLRRTEEVLRGGVSEPKLRSALLSALERADKRVIRMDADFTQGGMLDESYLVMQPLRRAGFLRLSAVEVTLEDGLVSDLKRASSGQLSMISALLALASVIMNASLVLIDEPELSLHPEWQVQYVDLLTRTFARYQGCHFVVATHSPLVVSQLPSHANVISLDQEGVAPVLRMQGQSADYLLAEAFGFPTSGNLHVKNMIRDALLLVANGDARSQRFRDLLTDLQRLGREIEPASPAKAIIDNLEEVASEAGRSAPV